MVKRTGLPADRNRDKPTLRHAHCGQHPAFLEEETTVGDGAAPSSRPPSSVHEVATLFVMTGVDAGQMFVLDDSPIVLGRSHSVDLHFDDGAISRKHARIW